MKRIALGTNSVAAEEAGKLVGKSSGYVQPCINQEAVACRARAVN